MIKTNYSKRRRSSSNLSQKSTTSSNQMYISNYQKYNKEVYNKIPSFELIDKNKNKKNNIQIKKFNEYFKNRIIRPCEMKKKELSTQILFDMNNISNNESNFSSTHRMSNSLGYIQRLNNSRQKNIEEKNQNNITKQKFNSVDYNYENKSKEKKILFLNSDDYNKLYTNLKYYWIKTPTLKYNNRNNSTKTLYSLKKNNQGFKTSRDNYNPRNEDSNNISILKYMIKTKPKDDKINLRKTFLNSGIHIYDIQDKSPYLSKDNIFEFKLRVNNDDKTKRKIINIKNKIKEQNGL